MALTSDDPLHALAICEDGAEEHPLTPETVVLRDVWGIENFYLKARALADDLGLLITGRGWREEGIAVDFLNTTQAAVFRMFYEGDTLAA